MCNVAGSKALGEGSESRRRRSGRDTQVSPPSPVPPPPLCVEPPAPSAQGETAADIQESAGPFSHQLQH